MKRFTHNGTVYQAKLWEEHGHSRLYISKETRFKNRPLESVGYWNLVKDEFIASRGYNHLTGDMLKASAMSAYERGGDDR